MSVALPDIEFEIRLISKEVQEPAGWFYGVAQSATGELVLREQEDDPVFKKDYANGQFQSQITYLFTYRHAVLQVTPVVMPVRFTDDGVAVDLAGDPPSPVLTKITDLFDDSNSNDLDRDAVGRAILASISAETKLLLAQLVLGAISTSPVAKQLFCAIAASCTIDPSTITYTPGNIIYWSVASVLAPDYDGSSDSIDCDKATGWVVNKNSPNTPASARIFLNGILAGTVTATLPRSDVSDVLGLTNTTGHIYGFVFAIPDQFRTGSPITVEVKPLSGTNAFRLSPRTSQYACVSLGDLINVAVDKTATSDLAIEPSLPLSSLTDEDSSSYFSTQCITEATGSFAFTVDLAGTANAQQIKLQPIPDNAGQCLPVDFILYGSTDNVNYFVMATVVNQPRGLQEVVIPVEKALDGTFRAVRYVKLIATKITGDPGCNRLQLAGFSVMVVSLTPLNGTPPIITRQPKKLEIFGPLGQNEGTSTTQTVQLTYTNGDTEDVTAAANRNTGNDFSLTWGADGVLFAAVNSTSGDTRGATLTAVYLGLTTTKVLQIYDASITRYITSYRIDRIENATTIIEGGAAANFKITALFNLAPFEEQYTGAGSYSVVAPYPNGMTPVTGMNAVGTVTLPLGSITANLSRILRFTFPAGGGYVEKQLDLINVADAIQFDRYEIVGANSITEGQTDGQADGVIYRVDAVYTDASRVPYTDAGTFSLKTPYPNGLVLDALSNTRAGIRLPIDSITATIQQVLYFTFPNNSQIQKTIALTNVNPTLPPGAGGCSGYAKATNDQYNAWQILSVIEFQVNSTTSRAFATRAEAIAGMQSLNTGSPSGRIDQQRCSSSVAAVGSTLYGNNQPPDGDYQKWPAEAGWWGAYYNATPDTKYLLQTNACGEIISKELYTGS